MAWTDSNLAAGYTIKAVHITEIRDKLIEATSDNPGFLSIALYNKLNNLTVFTSQNYQSIASGLLSSADYSAFVALRQAQNSALASVTGTTPVQVSTTSGIAIVSMNQANASTNGFLSSSDWVRFNNATTISLANYYTKSEAVSKSNDDIVNSNRPGTMSPGMLANLNDLTAKASIGAVPIGGVVMFWPPDGQIGNYFNTGTSSLLGKSTTPIGDMSRWALAWGQSGISGFSVAMPVFKNESDKGGPDRPYSLGVFPVGCSEFNQSDSLGGAKEVKLTINQMPKHNHDIPVSSGITGSTTIQKGVEPGSTVKYTTEDKGGDEAHTNMPPYQKIYFIIRIA